MTMDKTTRDLLAQLQIQSFTVSVMIADVLEGKADDLKELGRQISALDTYIEACRKETPKRGLFLDTWK